MFARVMLGLTEFELSIAQRYSSNFNYICRLKADAWHWRTELLRSGK